MTVAEDIAISIFGSDGEVRTFREIEADVIEFAMRLYGGNASEVAHRLKIGRSTLSRRLERYEDVKRRFNDVAIVVETEYRSAA